MSDPQRPSPPLNPMPRNTARQITALMIVPGLVPFLVLQSLTSVFRGGFNLWMHSWLPDVAVSGVAGAIVAWGIFHHSRWLQGFALRFGQVVLALYGLGFVLGVVILTGLVPRAAPDLAFMNVVNVIEWVVFSPLVVAVWFLVRSDWVRSRAGAAKRS